jgi:MSHA biogenesis protein MshI
LLQLFKKKIRKDSLVAVCLDGHAVTVARVKQDKGMPPLLKLCEYQEVENQSLRGAEIARLTNNHHLYNFECISTLELGNYNLLLVEAPDVQPEELRAAIRWRVKDLIDFHIDDAVVDVFEVPNQKTAGNNRMMYAVVARSDVIKQNIDQLTGAGLNLNVIDIPELALRNIASLLPEDVGGVALVYIGDHYGLITITRQSTLYFSRRIDIGLNGLPDTSRSGSQENIQRWLDGIIVEIQRSLDYYESHFSQPQVSAIVISPLGREVPGMLDYLSSQVDVPVRILNVNELIDVDTSVSEEMQSKCMLAIGAALRQESVTL